MNIGVGVGVGVLVGNGVSVGVIIQLSVVWHFEQLPFLVCGEGGRSAEWQVLQSEYPSE